MGGHTACSEGMLGDRRSKACHPPAFAVNCAGAANVPKGGGRYPAAE
jgi:hypothetical protein